MAHPIPHRSFVKKALVVGLLIWLVYAVLSWLAPVNATTQAKYHLTQTQLHVIVLSVSIPLGAIWLIAIFGATRLWQYSLTIRKNREGRGFMLLSYGLLILVGQLILSSFVNLLGTYKPALSDTAGLINVYEAAGLALVSFSLIAMGTERLVNFVGVAKQARTMMGIAFIILAAVGWLYIRFIIDNQYRTSAGGSGLRPTYGVSDALIFLTIVPLYLVAWFTGLVAFLNVLLFQRRVEGIIYRQFFSNFAIGFFIIIGLSIFLQLLTQFSAYLNDLSLNTLLVVVYIILALMSAGYLFVAKGAGKLFKIEIV